MSHEELILYSFRRCPFAMRIRLSLHEKGIAFSVREERLSALSAELRALHPEAKVPVLVHGAHVIYESAIIAEYIEDAFPNHPPLLPSSASARAAVRLWTYWCNQYFKWDVDRLKYGASRFAESDCVGVADRLQLHLTKLEAALAGKSAGRCWLVGEELSLADIHVFPFCRQLARIKPRPDLIDSFPLVMAWMQAIEARPSFGMTMA